MPHHIIIPYEDPEPISPCDKTVAATQLGNHAIIADKTSFPIAMPVIKKNTDAKPVIATTKEKKVTKTVKKPAPVQHLNKKNN